MIPFASTGKGHWAIIIMFGFSLAANLITDFVTGSGAFWKHHRWPFGTSLLFSAIACWMIGREWENKEARVLVDPQTGEEVILKESHTLFFIPMPIWGPIFAILGLLAFAAELLGM